jgi:uncharacterized lipoprotein YmbA
MSANRLALAAGVLVAVGACAIGKPIPQTTTYLVSPPTATSNPSAARRPDVLRIGKVRVAAPYSGNALVYRVDEVQYVSDPYHAFIAEPGAMLGHEMADWLERAGPFSAVAQPDSATPASYVLDATITELYGDFRKGARPAAMLAVQFSLIDQTGVRPQLVRERRLESRVELTQASPDLLVQGYGTALAEILAQLARELGP